MNKGLKKFKHEITKLKPQQLIAIVIVLAITVVGVNWLLLSHAQTPFGSSTADSGIVSAPATVNIDPSASSGKSITFNSAPSPPIASIQAPPNNNNYFGISLGCCGISDPNISSELTAMQAMHVKWLRIGVDWSSIEPSMGTYNWTNLTNFINLATTDGFSIDPVISNAPSWAKTSGCTQTVCQPTTGIISGTSESGIQAYANFASTLASKFSQLNVFEIWNEPNFSASWYWPTGTTPNATDYTELLKAAYASIHSVDPHATVLTAGFSADQKDITASNFLREIYADGGGGSFDAAAYHPYCYSTLSGCPGSGPGWQEITNIRNVMVQNGDANKQLWATEYGAPDGTHTSAITPAQQATLITDTYNLWRQYPWAGPLFWFNYNDGDAGTTGQGFGIGNNPAAISAYTSLASGN